MTPEPTDASDRGVTIGRHGLGGILNVGEATGGLIVFAHGSGSSRFSPRNAYVARRLRQSGFGTLLFDLLTEAEAVDRSNVFDIPLLADRVGEAVLWAVDDAGTARLPIGLFGASTGAAAALVAASRFPDHVEPVVSRGGRPDLAGAVLGTVRAATLLIVGGNDHGVIELNQAAFAALACEKRLEIVPGATHLFEEPGTLDAVVDHAARWFARHLAPDAAGGAVHDRRRTGSNDVS